MQAKCYMGNVTISLWYSTRGKRLMAVTVLCLAFASIAACADKTGMTQKKLYPFCRGDRWGYIDSTGQIAIPRRFEFGGDFREGCALVGRRNGRLSWIHAGGQPIFELPDEFPKVVPVGTWSEGLVAVRIGEKFGYLNRHGRLEIEPTFDNARAFSNGLAAVNVGAVLIVDDVIGPSIQGGKWGYIDREGEWVVRPKFESAYEFHDGLAKIWNSRSGGAFVDRTGGIVLRPLLRAWDFSEGLARVHASTGYGFMNKSGAVKIPATFEYARIFSDGLAAVRIDERFGYIDRAGRQVIDPLFDEANDFQEGLACVKVSGVWKYIDKKGKVVIASRTNRDGSVESFNDAEDFDGELARVHVGGARVLHPSGQHLWRGGEWFYVNRSGKIVRSCCRDAEGGAEYGHRRG